MMDVSTRKQRTQQSNAIDNQTRNKVPRLQRYKECVKNDKTIFKSIFKGSGVYSMYSLKRSTRLNSVQMMIREYKRLTESSHIHVMHMVQALEEYAKQNL